LVAPLGPSLAEKVYKGRLTEAETTLETLDGVRRADPAGAANSLVKAHDALVAAVNDGLAREIYSHAAINPRSDGIARPISKWNWLRKWKWKNPAYIDRQLFGQAMLDVLKISPEIANAAKKPNAPFGKPTVDELKTAVQRALQDAATAIANAAKKPNAPVDDQLQKFLDGIIERSLGDPDKIKGELVAWFDNAMDRVSGWYKRCRMRALRRYRCVEFGEPRNGVLEKGPAAKPARSVSNPCLT